jgi:hypothetical protein
MKMPAGMARDLGDGVSYINKMKKGWSYINELKKEGVWRKYQLERECVGPPPWRS